MGLFGKLIGAGLGFTLGGPIGALIGLGLGAMIDNSNTETIESGNSQRQTAGDFVVSLLVLIAAVMKADNKILKSELDFVKSYLVRQFGSDSSSEALKILRDILKQEIPLEDVCLQIKSRLDYPSRLELLHLLYGVANADGHVHESEVKIIDRIAYYMGISANEHSSIKNMYYKSADSSYKILDIEKTATDEEVKKAYRKLAIQFHPDKVSYLGEEFKKTAEEKFRMINEAYELIKKERGIK